MKQLLQRYIFWKIEHANDEEISELILAIQRRYDRLHPEWDTILLSLKKDPKEREQQFELFREFILKHNFRES